MRKPEDGCPVPFEYRPRKRLVTVSSMLSSLFTWNAGVLRVVRYAGRQRCKTCASGVDDLDVAPAGHAEALERPRRSTIWV